MKLEPFEGQRALTLRDELQGRDERELADAFAALEATGRIARLYLSYVAVPGLTPPALTDDRTSSVVLEGSVTDSTGKRQRIQRREGIFPLEEGAISFMNHGLLYGDGVFEGERIDEHGRWILAREHGDRMTASLRGIGLTIPFTQEEYRQKVLRTIQAVRPEEGRTYYARALVSSGDGDMGINRKKCVGAFVGAFVGGIRLYPDSAYTEGVDLGVADHVILAVKPPLDPRVKATQYLKNILALLDGTKGTPYNEALMIAADGCLAEATVDNVFLAVTGSSGKATIYTPPTTRCLNGLTRRTVMLVAQEAGMDMREEEIPRERFFDAIRGKLPGAKVEVFITGTGARLLPVRSVAGISIGDGRAGPVFKQLLEAHDRKVADSEMHVHWNVSDAEFRTYLQTESPYALFRRTGELPARV